MKADIVGGYQLCEEIARGHLGAVYRGKDVDTGKAVAVKEVNGSRGDLKEVENEAQALKRIKSPHVVPLIAQLCTPSSIYLVTPFYTLRDLERYVQRTGPVPEDIARPWVRSIVLALVDMREAGLVHRDVKLSHVLIDDSGTARLSGLGFSKLLPAFEITRSVLGTPVYMAPEVLARRAYDYKVDVWSLGVLLYRLLLASEPYQVSTIEELAQAQTQTLVFPRYSPLSPQAKSLIVSLMKYDPNGRPDYTDILNSSFFNQIQTGLPMKDCEVEGKPLNDSLNALEKASPASENEGKVVCSSPMCDPPMPQPSESPISANVSISPMIRTDVLPLHESDEGSSFGFIADPAKEGNAMEFSLIEMAAIEDEYSLVGMGENEDTHVDAEDCKILLPIAAHYHSTNNLPMARAIYCVCQKTYETERRKGKKILKGVSMQASYIEKLMEKVDERLEAVQKELEKLGPGRIATAREVMEEVRTRLALAGQGIPTARKEAYEDVLQLVKVGFELSQRTGSGDEEWLLLADSCRTEINKLVLD